MVTFERIPRACAGTETVSLHLKVDTGMGRLGVAVAELPAVLDALKQAGIFDCGPSISLATQRPVSPE